MLDPNNVIVQDTPKDLPAEWIGAADIPTASEQLVQKKKKEKPSPRDTAGSR